MNAGELIDCLHKQCSESAPIPIYYTERSYQPVKASDEAAALLYPMQTGSGAP